MFLSEYFSNILVSILPDLLMNGIDWSVINLGTPIIVRYFIRSFCKR